ncbi:hypothetical protein CMEL01_07737 [Colletotrichum melonis]|uniref:DUF6594 domain-containing protein n=1 Tax=Colletotrichum melonis TaxID=1209925 RepID=A0AAI9U2E2_9PEZI|nr:hypothetical protein CMEL01_07737 [Colletotrichum melonis]
MMNLLRLQSELQDLEQQLEDTRDEDRNSTNPIRREYGSSFRVMKQYAEDPDSIQYELLLEIGKRLDEYHQAVQHASSLQKLPRPSDDEWEFLATWLRKPKGGNGFLDMTGIEAMTWNRANQDDTFNIGGPAVGTDRFTKFMNGKVVNLYHRVIGQHSTVSIHFTQTFPSCSVRSIQTNIHTEKSSEKLRPDDTRAYNEEKISRFSDIILATLSAALPTLAILALYFVQNMLHRIGLVIVLTMIFSVLFALLTGAKKAEIFAATAAFAAVEVVYIGSVASNDPVCVCSSSQA